MEDSSSGREHFLMIYFHILSQVKDFHFDRWDDIPKDLCNYPIAIHCKVGYNMYHHEIHVVFLGFFKKHILAAGSMFFKKSSI